MFRSKVKSNDPYQQFLMAIEGKKQKKIREVYDPSIHTWIWACENKHLNVLNWLDEYGDNECTSEVMDWAAHEGNLEVVIWLYAHNKRCTTSAIDYAAMNNHLNTVKWLNEYGMECTVKAMEQASLNGHYSIVEYLCSYGKDITDKALENAITNNHTKIVEFLKSNIEKTNTMKFACKNGYLNLIKILYKSDEYNFTPEIIDIAKCNGHTNVVSWFGLIDYKKNVNL